MFQPSCGFHVGCFVSFPRRLAWNLHIIAGLSCVS
uniref:Uncharacterized protein n=1 Tax=Octopus bimaculoides TaxID=37653 RepID=A0A0L8FL09_OCTBM